MKFLTTNSSGKSCFGGIYTRLKEYIKNSPEHTFHIIELNHEKKYISRENKILHKVDLLSAIESDNVAEVLNQAKNYKDFNKRTEKIVNEFQNTIQAVNPDIIWIPGTSLSSYFLFKAARREGHFDRTIHSYAGIVEKELGSYSGDPRYILTLLGKEFVSNEALENITYIFPSNHCKETVEEIHKIKMKNTHVVHNGISRSFIEGGYNRHLPGELVLGYVGRVQPVKNPDFFLNLNDNMKEDVKLKIITDLLSAVNKSIGKTLIRKLNSGEVFFHHPIQQQELKKFYESQVSAIIIPSFFETYCNVAMESTVCGTTALLSDNTGAKEIFKKFGLENLLFSVNDFKSFESALNNARDRNFTIEEELTRDIYNELSWEKVIGEYNQIAEKVIE